MLGQNSFFMQAWKIVCGTTGSCGDSRHQPGRSWRDPSWHSTPTSGQSKQLLELFVYVNFPSSQVLHTDALSADWYRPGLQVVQVVLPNGR